MNTPIAAILAGGRSLRMGRDKATILVNGEQLLSRTIRVCNAAGLETVVVGREAVGERGASHKFIADLYPGQGPLGGIVSAVVHTGRPVLALGCDMPLLRPEILKWLCFEWLKEPGGLGLITQNGNHIEPLFSVYSTPALKFMEALFQKGDRSIKAVIGKLDFRYCNLPSYFIENAININTEEELRIVEGKARASTQAAFFLSAIPIPVVRVTNS